MKRLMRLAKAARNRLVSRLGEALITTNTSASTTRSYTLSVTFSLTSSPPIEEREDQPFTDSVEDIFAQMGLGLENDSCSSQEELSPFDSYDVNQYSEEDIAFGLWMDAIDNVENSTEEAIAYGLWTTPENDLHGLVSVATGDAPALVRVDEVVHPDSNLSSARPLPDVDLEHFDPFADDASNEPVVSDYQPFPDIPLDEEEKNSTEEVPS